MVTSMKFLHAMRQRDYLEQALRQGLMLTEHQVSFRPFADLDDAARLTGEVLLPRLQARLDQLGPCEVDMNLLVKGIGAMSGSVPMVCFTEVHEGRDPHDHLMLFGPYGLVVRRDWLEANGGDRVLYAGPRSRVTQRLHLLFVEHQLAGLHVHQGKAMYTSQTVFPILDLLAYVETRANLEEVEWRIAGEHGFTGRRRNAGERIPLPLDAIEQVIVREDAEVAHFSQLLASLPGAGSLRKLPPVLAQPDVL